MAQQSSELAPVRLAAIERNANCFLLQGAVQVEPRNSHDELIRLAYPPWRERTNLRADVRRLVKMLEEANELRVVDGRILPPGNSEPDTD